MKVNLGCGASPTPGWVNIDNSLTVRIARTPLRALFAGKAEFASKVRTHDVRFGNALSTGLPDNSVDVLYSSHMLEHLDTEEASKFLTEARRVLKPGGRLRIAVPDLRKIVENYNRLGDADALVSATFLAVKKPKSLLAKLKFVFFTGFREHHWMYDASSLERLLMTAGFLETRVYPPGKTGISDPGALDLRERQSESLYMEAVSWPEGTADLPPHD